MNDNFSKFKCSAAYHGISINHAGDIDPCCQYYRNPQTPPVSYINFFKFQNTVQSGMHQDAHVGIAHAGCKKCWQEEQSGWPSLRQTFNKQYPTDNTIFVSSDNPVKHIELRLGNLCNLNCIMCWPGASSSINTERQLHQEKFQSIGVETTNYSLNHYWETPEFLDFIKKIFNTAELVNLTGGEPFMIPEVLDMLDLLMPKKDTVKLSFNTNLTRLSNNLINRIKEFKNLNIVISLEGIGEKNNYIRYPSDWGQISNNISLLKSQVPHAFLSINHTFQHTSIYSFPDLWEFCFDQNLMLHKTSVQGNPVLTLDTVPPDDIVKFKQWLDNTKIANNQQEYNQLNNFISQAKFDLLLSKKFYEYIAVLDSIRGTDFFRVFTPSQVIL